MIRLAFMLCLVAAPAFAAEPIFSKEEVETAYAMGRADAAREALAATPAARSVAEKMKPEPASRRMPEPEAHKKVTAPASPQK